MWKSLNDAAVRLLAAAAIAAAASAAPAPALAGGSTLEYSSYVRVPDVGLQPQTRQIKVGLNKSVVLELPRDVGNVHIASPGVMDAVMQTGRRAYLVGTGVGETNAFFFDKNGEQILTLEILVQRDLTGVAEMLHRLIPGSNIRLETMQKSVALVGTVRTAADAARAGSILAAYLEVGSEKTTTTGSSAANALGGSTSTQAVSEKSSAAVINMLTVDAKEQVLLKVTVAEMQRNAVKQLGVDLAAVGNFGALVAAPVTGQFAPLAGTIPQGIVDGLTNHGYTINNQTPPNRLIGRYTGSDGTIAGVLRAMERNGLMRTLAEPNLTAISGETANFLAGGEFPIPIAQDNNTITVEFKPFGVGLSFTPMVLSEGRISMRVSTEVSELSSDGAITLSSINIPALKVRRANTTIELPSGGSLVMAGLLSDETKQALEGIPGLKNIPVLGNLFRSRDYIKRETELVVIVTPYVVDPVARSKLARPDDGFLPGGDKETYLLGHLNRVYGKRPGHMPVGSYKGDFGFIIE